MEGNGQALKRIAIVGPECTGKTELSKFLAQQYQTPWVPEFARDYIDQLNRPYEQHDLVAIAKGQLLLEDKLALSAKDILICDTTLLVIKIWSEFKYGNCPGEIINLMSQRKYDLHLLTYVDIPWVDDPQREHPDKRNELFELYKTELVNNNVPFEIIKGPLETRRKIAIKAVEKVVSQSHLQM